MRLCFSAFVLAALISTSAAASQALAGACNADDIAKAVDGVGARLRSFNSDMMASLNPKLKQLQAKRGWSDQELAVKTQALLSDEEMTAYDAQAFEQFSRIDTLGSAGGQAPDCKRFDEIEAAAKQLLGTMRA